MAYDLNKNFKEVAARMQERISNRHLERRPDHVIAIYRNGQIICSRHLWPHDIELEEIITERITDYKVMRCNICNRKL